MTTFYDLGYVYATSQTTAEQEARAKATSLNQKEKSLIKAREVKS